MKDFRNRTRLSFFLMFSILFQSILPGCNHATQISAILTVTINKSIQTPTMTNPSQTPFAPSNVLLANIPPDCGSAKTWSAHLKWAIIPCGPNADIVAWRIGEKQTITLFKSQEIDGYYATFSPDEKKLLVAIQNGPLWFFEVGQWQTPKMLFPKLPTFATPTWSPDSNSFAISYLVEGQALSIMKLDGNYKNILALHEVNSAYWDYGVNMFGPSWSPDGSLIAYTIAKDMDNHHPVQLWTIDVVSGKKNLLYSGKPGEEAYQPDWSPDGSKILVVNRMSVNNNMYVYDFTQKTFSVLPKFDDPFPSVWSLDSQRLAVCDKGNQYVISLKTSQTKLVSPVCGIIQWKDNNNIVIEYQNRLFLLVVP